jgi:hypothetical protein
MDMLNGSESQQQLRRGSVPHILYSQNKNIWGNDDEQWKAVGSPQRRPSLTGTLGYTATNGSSMMSQNLRNSGVPSIKEDTAENLSLLTQTPSNKGVNIPQNLPGQNLSSSQWDSLASSWSGGSSIWKSNYSMTSGLGGPSSSLLNSAASTGRNDLFANFGSTNSSGIQQPPPRQYRSFSVSVGALGPMNENYGNNLNSAATAAAALTSQFPLSEKDEIENERLQRLNLNENRIDEADEVNGDLDKLSELIDNSKSSGLGGLDSFGNSKFRSRSKSSSDTFGIMNNYNMNSNFQNNHQRYHSQKNLNNYVMGATNNNLSSAFLNNNNIDLFSSVLNNTTSTSTTDLQSKSTLLSPLQSGNSNGNGLSSIMTTSSVTPTSQLNNNNGFMFSTNESSTINTSSLLTTPTTTLPPSTLNNNSSLLTQQQQNKLMFSNMNIPSTIADSNTTTGMNNVNILSNQWTNNTGITSTTSSPFRSTTENQALAHKRSNTQPVYPLWNTNNVSTSTGPLSSNDQVFSTQNNFMPGMNMNGQQSQQAQTQPPQPNQIQPQALGAMNSSMMQPNGPNDFLPQGMNGNNRMAQVQNSQQQRRNRFFNNNIYNGNQNGMNQPMYTPTFDQNFNGNNDMDFMMQQQFNMRRNSGMSMNNMMPGMYQNMPMGMNIGMNMGMNNNGMNDMMMMQHYNRGHGMMMNSDNMYINDINDYFENTEYRTRAWVEAGKNLHQMQQNVYHWPLYVIEFKAGRTDYFYVPENSGLTIKIGDLVIVEADRGKDLGKVIVNNIKNLAQLVAYHAERGNPRHLIIDDDMNNNNVPNIPITWPKSEGAGDASATGTTEGDKTSDKTTTDSKEKTAEDEVKKDEANTTSAEDGKESITKEEDKKEDNKEKTGDEKTDATITTTEGDEGKVNEENLQFPKDIHPKRIYRMAQPAEVNMLVQKNTDENSSMLLCQQKVRQRNMPMEVVDAEYQWDRRKLTFYFVSERRIDFRELVRDLFKVYKTRIWMCAVSSLTTMKAYQAFNINIVSPSNMNEQTIAQLQNMTIEDKKEGEEGNNISEAPATTSIPADTGTTTTSAVSTNEEVKSVEEKKEEDQKVETSTNVNKTDVKTAANLEVANTNSTMVPTQTPTPPPSLPPSQVQTPK